jgi:diguanylate cyclase (GGDEF)-like protein
MPQAPSLPPAGAHNATRTPSAARTTGAALRDARRAWRLLHLDANESAALASRSLQRAQARQDLHAQGWARLARGFHHLYFASPQEATAELTMASACFQAVTDRAGELLAGAGIGRALWRTGQVDEALAHLLLLRDEGLRLLKHEQRGVLLNAIAGCYSTLGRSEEAFAYMFEALRGAGPARGHGFDAALHCNLSHELMELGDHEEALDQVRRGLERMQGLRNARLEAVLLLNRITSLTELGRARQALPDVERVCALPVNASGRGTSEQSFEVLALAALRAGETELGEQLLRQARSGPAPTLADVQMQLALAEALLAHTQGDASSGLKHLKAVTPMLGGARDLGDASAARASLRLRCLHAQLESELHEAMGQSAAALSALRRWQALSQERALLASRARYQAATLQTELLRLRQRLEENDAKRRATEKARAELALANQALSRKIDEVQALQEALHEQATRDALTGLFNRRHLNEHFPALLALAAREGQPLAVVLVDLDLFKQVNDQHGHAAGDTLLAAFGQLMRRQLRASDCAFRYGGEEFCLLLPHTAAAAAADKIEQLLALWRQQVFELEDGRLAQQSFSAGVADTRLAGNKPAELLRAADELLLAAKRAGRARVCCAS